MKIYWDNENSNAACDFTINGSINDIRMLMIQLASNIIARLGVFQNKTSERVLRDYTNWAEHGYTNAFQSQVSILYNFVKSMPKTTLYFFFDRDERDLMRNALYLWQETKESMIKKEKEEMGCPNWGDATGFNKMDWSDQGHKLSGE